MRAGGGLEGVGGRHESRVINALIGNDRNSGMGWEGGLDENGVVDRVAGDDYCSLRGMWGAAKNPCTALHRGAGHGIFFFHLPLALFLWFTGPRFCFPPLNHRSGALFFAGHRLGPSSL